MQSFLCGKSPMTAVKVFAISLILFPSFGKSLARTVEGAPDFDAWISEIRKTTFPLQTVPQRILLLESKIDDPAPKNFLKDASALEKISPFIFVDEPSLSLTQKLNRDLATEGSKGRVPGLAGTTSANVIISDMEGNSPVLYVNNGKTLRRVGTVKPFKMEKTPDAILGWLFQSLGYDGVLLGRKGSYVMVASAAAVLGKEKIQALAIRGSEAQMALLDKKRSGSSLLELESSKGPYGMFRILALAKDSNDLPSGMKLTIQRDTKSTQDKAN